MPSNQTDKQQAIKELDAFFKHHAAALTPERITIELEKIPQRYELEQDDVLVDYIRKRINETSKETHPELHKHGQSYLRLKYLEEHGNVSNIFDTNE